MGEWEKEPDELDFEAHGLQCQMRRGPMKHWCGYVAVPEDHALYGKHYSDKIKVSKEVIGRQIDVDKVGAINLFCAAVNADDLENGQLDVVLAFDVHGGLTYSEDHAPTNKSDGKWWFGFDCAHAGDLTPGGPFDPHWDDVYRNVSYVRDETQNLAKQLAEFSFQESAG